VRRKTLQIIHCYSKEGDNITHTLLLMTYRRIFNMGSTKCTRYH